MGKLLAMGKKKQPTILIIDDDKQLSVLVNQILVTKKYHAIIANTYNDVKNWLNDVSTHKQNPPNLILLDLLMPELDGISMYQWLRKQNITKHTPIIVLTAVDSVSKRVECLSMGADDYIVKPFAMSELLTRIDVHLQLGELRLAKIEAEAQIASQTRFLDVINMISHQAAQHLNLDRMLAGVTKEVTTAFHCKLCAVYLYDPETNHLSCLGHPNQKAKRNPCLKLCTKQLNKKEAYLMALRLLRSLYVMMCLWVRYMLLTVGIQR